MRNGGVTASPWTTGMRVIGVVILVLMIVVLSGCEDPLGTDRNGAGNNGAATESDTAPDGNPATDADATQDGTSNGDTSDGDTSGSDQGDTAPATPLRVSGVVRLSMEGEGGDLPPEPLGGAYVELWMDGEKIAETVTAADGSYQLETQAASIAGATVVVSVEYQDLPANLVALQFDTDGFFAGAVRSVDGNSEDVSFTFLPEPFFTEVSGSQVMVSFWIEETFDENDPPARMVANVQQLQAIALVDSGSSGGGSGEEDVIIGSNLQIGDVLGDAEPVEVPVTLLQGDYVLVRDIDASGTAGWNDGAGWIPIGTWEGPFTGSLDGQGFTISGLTMGAGEIWGSGGSRYGEPAGLFGHISGEALLQNLNISGLDISFPDDPNNGGSEPDSIGGVVGLADGSDVLIQNIVVSGTVYAPDFSTGIGGLVGTNQFGRIENSQATVSVTGGGSSGVGGLAGLNLGGVIIGSEAHGAVMGDSVVGGLVGQNANESPGEGEDEHEARIEDSRATGAVTGTGSRVGGLVGFNFKHAIIESSEASGAVTGDDQVGGLVGQLGQGSDGGSIAGSSAFGDVYGETNVGGLVGFMGRSPSTISMSTASGTVTATGNNSPAAGLLIGYLDVDDNFEEVTLEGEYAIIDGNDEESRIVESAGQGSVVDADPQPGPQIGNLHPGH